MIFVAQHKPNVLVAILEFEPSKLQDLVDAIPQLLALKANLSLRFQVRIEVGDGKEQPPPGLMTMVNKLLSEVKNSLELR